MSVGGTCMEVSRQLEGSLSFLILSVSQVLNEGPQAWQQVSHLPGPCKLF